METQSKSILTSVTFWGALLSFLLPAITPKLQQYGIPVPDATSLAAKIVGAVTFGITVYGRLRASQPVHVVPPATPPPPIPPQP